MGRHRPLGNGQTDPIAFGARAPLAPPAKKGIEDHAQFIRGHADPLIRNLNAHHLARRFDAGLDYHAALGWRMPYGVADHVLYGTMDQFDPAADRHMALRLQGDVDPLGLGFEPGIGHHFG
jgi:hypothetical protein